jgi:hypothetical protein
MKKKRRITVGLYFMDVGLRIRGVEPSEIPEFEPSE